MDLLSSQIYLSDEDVAKVKSLAIFVALFYVPYSLRSAHAATAAWDDLQYYREMHQLSELAAFHPITEAVLKSLERHSAYREAAALVFALFSEDFPAEERQKVAASLSSMPRPEVIPTGNPLFVSIRGVKNLADHVGERSWLMFNLLKWTLHGSKMVSRNRLRGTLFVTAVVKDGAECGRGDWGQL